MSIYERLQMVREELGLTIKAFGEKTDLPYRTAQSYLSGDREPNAEGMKKMCVNLRVNINWLLTGDGECFLDENQTAGVVDQGELKLLRIYRNCNDTGKRIILGSAESLKNIPNINK